MDEGQKECKNWKMSKNAVKGFLLDIKVHCTFDFIVAMAPCTKSTNDKTCQHAGDQHY